MNETERIVQNLHTLIAERKVVAPSAWSEACTLLAILYGEECTKLTEKEIAYYSKVADLEKEYDLPDIKIKNKSKLTEEYKEYRNQEVLCKTVKELIQSIKKHSTNLSAEMTMNDKF